MALLRKVGKHNLQEGTSVATKGMFVVLDTETGGTSFWFDTPMKDELLALDEEKFTEKCNDIVQQPNE